jgi:two-component system, chemotaxis family, response regulator Rcp1
MHQEAVGRPMEILLIEDSLVAAKVTIGALSRSGIEHRLTWVSDGREAKEFLFQQGKYARAPRPDLILLDLNLPHIDGKTLLSEIRCTEELKEIPVVIMTGAMGESGILQFRDLDVQGYLTKPVDLDQFLELVEELKGYWKADMILGQQ